MMDAVTTERGGTRRRGASLEATILQAAWEELQAVGYARVTMEGVAARARTGKQVLYRRWPNRAQLLVAAMRHALGPIVVEVPDTGGLRGDVLAVLRLMAERVRRLDSEIVYGLLSEVRDLDFEVPRGGSLAIMTQVIGNAVRRGELRHADLNPRVLTLPMDLLRYEGLLRHTPINSLSPEGVEALLAEIVDDVFLPLVLAVAGARDGGVAAVRD